jgi:uncharacterized protein
VAIFVSPGAYVREIDLSLYVPAISTTIFGVVGTSSKGPVNEATFVSSQADFVRKFGDPGPDHLMTYAAMQYLRRGTKLWVVRVGTAIASSVDVIGAVTPAQAISSPNPWTFASPGHGEVTGSVLGPFTITGGDTIDFEVLDESGVGIIHSPFSVSFGATGSKGAQFVCDTIINATNFAVAEQGTGADFSTILASDKIKIRAIDAEGGDTTGEVTLSTPAPSAATLASELNTGLDAIFGAGYLVAEVYDTTKVRIFTSLGGPGASITFLAPSSQDATAKIFGDGVVIGTPIQGVTRVQVDAVNQKDGSPTVVYDPSLDQGAAYVRLRNPTHTGGLSGILIDSGGAASTVVGLDAPAGTNPETGNDYVNADELNAGSNGTNKLTLEVGDDATIEPATPISRTFVFTPGSAVTAEAARLAILSGTNATYLTALGLTVTLTSDNRLRFVRRYIPGTLNEANPSDTTYIQAIAATTTVKSTSGSGNNNQVWSVFSKQYGSSGGDATMKVTAKTPGTWGDTLKVVVTDGSGEGTFKVIVWQKHPVTDLYVVAETWDNLDYSTTSDRFFPDVINDEITGSQYITVTDTGLLNEIPGTTAGGIALTGGDDGVTSVTDADYIGTNPAPTGLQIFKSSELLDVNLLAVPGISSPEVIDAMITVCETRGDAMCLVDPPQGLSVQQVVDWHNGAGPYSGSHAAFNTSYGALFWPWVKTYDPYNAINVTTPPSGHMAGVIAYTDYIRQLWFAPAGLQRGLLPSAIDLETTSPSQGDRDLLNGYPNNVNPLVKFSGIGIAAWGQKTLWRMPSAVDRINVRRLLLYARKIVASTVRYLVFEPNDPPTWRAFVRLVQPWLENIRQKRGLIDFRVVCDETTNPPDQIDQNTMVGRIYLKPTKAAEIVQVDFVLTSTGARFEELVY